jgi:hypothetical protein
VPTPQERQVIAQLGLRVLALLLDILTWYSGRAVGGSHPVLSSHDSGNLEGINYFILFKDEDVCDYNNLIECIPSPGCS